MKLFKDSQNNIFAYELDGSQDHLIGDKTAITQEEAETMRPVYTLTYAEKRAAEYPPIGDQLDALWKGGAEAEAMLAKVQAVKQKYPKGVA